MQLGSEQARIPSDPVFPLPPPRVISIWSLNTNGQTRAFDTYVDQLLSVSKSELAANLVHDLLLLGLL